MKRKVAIFILGMLSVSALSGCETIRLVRLYKSTKKQELQSVVADTIDIPFSYQRDWIMLHLLLKQGAHSLEGDFLFDSGAFTSLFDSCQPIAVGTPQNVAELPVKGAYGTSYSKVKIAKNIYLQAGQYAILKPTLMVSEKPEFFPPGCLGIIGADFFRDCVLTIDFKHQRFHLQAPDRFNSAGMTALKMKTIANSNPIVQKVALGDLPPMDYLVDAGHSGSILIQKPDTQRLKAAMGANIREYARKQPKVSDASGKVVTSNYYTKTASTINGLQCPEYEVAGLVNERSDSRYENMGLGFMKQVFESISLNVPQKLFYYKINTQSASQEKMDREVYFRQEDSSFFTGPVLIQSKWFGQGLKPGMQVIHINDESPAVYINARKEGRSPEIRSITFSTTDGKSKTLTK